MAVDWLKPVTRYFFQNDADQDNLGEVEFFPSKGFPVIYYPYSNAEDYRPPLLFAKFSGAKKGVIIQVGNPWGNPWENSWENTWSLHHSLHIPW